MSSLQLFWAASSSNRWNRQQDGLELRPDTAKERLQKGLLMAISEGREIKLKAIDKVLFVKYRDAEFKFDGTEHPLLPSTDILARLLN